MQIASRILRNPKVLVRRLVSRRIQIGNANKKRDGTDKGCLKITEFHFFDRSNKRWMQRFLEISLRCLIGQTTPGTIDPTIKKCFLRATCRRKRRLNQVVHTKFLSWQYRIALFKNFLQMNGARDTVLGSLSKLSLPLSVAEQRLNLSFLSQLRQYFFQTLPL